MILIHFVNLKIDLLVPYEIRAQTHPYSIHLVLSEVFLAVTACLT